MTERRKEEKGREGTMSERQGKRDTHAIINHAIINHAIINYTEFHHMCMYCSQLLLL